MQPCISQPVYRKFVVFMNPTHWQIFHVPFSLADRRNYSALYDKSILKLGTLILSIVGNVLKIRGNLDRIWGSYEGWGGGIFQYGRHSDPKDHHWENEAKLT